MNNFSDRLRETRKQRQLTQEALAEKANISRVMVTRYETGQTIPTVEVLISLADALSVSIDYLLGRSAFIEPLPHTENLLCSSHETSHILSQPQIDFPKNTTELHAFIINVLKEQKLIDQ